MIRHPFGFLRYLVDFSFEKLEKAMRIAEEVTADDAPEVEPAVYDERGMESIRNFGLRMYLEDPLTTANLGETAYPLGNLDIGHIKSSSSKVSEIDS
jgi:hypothetical protein